MSDRYNVAFRYTKVTGGYHGVITWTGFESKAAFDAWYTDDLKARQEVVEEGVSEERCVELTQQTPLACRQAAILHDATLPDGTVDHEILAIKLQTLAFAQSVGVV